MNWEEVTIYTAKNGIDPLCGCLMQIGVTGFVIKDAEDFEEFLNDKNGKWDYIDDDLMGLKDCETSVTFYLADNAQGREMLVLIKSELERLKTLENAADFGRLELEMKNVREEDWANNWKKYFKPFNIGKKLLIKPSWEEANPEDGRRILEIDPASSFGTGQHNTTKLCLELLEKNVKQDDRILDLGCGSGILSIAAVLLGAKEVSAVDIMENAVATAGENAGKNGISADIYHTYFGDIISDTTLREKIGSGYDIIAANIVADVLIAMSTMFRSFLNPNGKIILSGIITERADEVIEAVKAAGFTILLVEESDGWAAVLAE